MGARDIRVVAWGALASFLVTAAVSIDHLAGWSTFIGDSDRLNTFLNLKLFEAASYRALGRVPFWNESSLLGYGVAGTYWMLPGFWFDIAMHAGMPLEALFRNAGHVSFALFWLALFSAFVYLHDLCDDTLASLAGACMYACSAFSISRLSQVDPAFFTLVAAPLGMLALRRMEALNWRRWATLLGALLTVLFGTGFLQEVAYLCILLGCYAAFLSLRDRNPLRVLALGAVAIAAIVIASPRIITVLEEFRQMARTTSLQGTDPQEVLRFAANGIFGRFHAESRALGNGINLHEGLLINATAAGALLFLGSLYTTAFDRHRSAVCGFLAMFALLLSAFLSIPGALLVSFAAVAAWGISRLNGPHCMRSITGSSEIPFHLVMLAAVLAVVLVPEVRRVFHRMFFGIDFLHSRFTVAGLLPLSVLLSTFLADLRPDSRNGRRTAAAGLIAGAATMAAIGSIGSLVDGLWRIGIRLPVVHSAISVGEALRILAIALSLAGAAVYCGRRPAIASALGGFFCAMVITESIQFGHQKMFGSHTASYPTPFAQSNYFNAPPGRLTPPSETERARVAEELERESYRSVIVAPPDTFQALVGPHLAEFYGMRLVDGYPTLTEATASLPWPTEIVNLRSLSFSDGHHLPWKLLALLNVKYAVRADRAVYFNEPVGGEGPIHRSAAIHNPFPPLPRHFFATEIFDASRIPPLPGLLGLSATLVEQGAVRLEWWRRFSNTSLIVEHREADAGEFRYRATLWALDRSGMYVDKGLVAGRRYAFRLREIDPSGRELYVSPIVEAELPVELIPAPEVLSARWIGPDAVSLALAPRKDDAEIVCDARSGVIGTYSAAVRTSSRAGEIVVRGLNPEAIHRLRCRAEDGDRGSVHSHAVTIGDRRYYAADLFDTAFPYDTTRAASVVGPLAQRAFPAGEVLESRYQHDRIRLDFAPIPEERFLVINEAFHPRWQARSGDRNLPVYRTNQVMRGVVVPPMADSVELRFVPYLATPSAWRVIAGGTLLLLIVLMLPLHRVPAGRLVYPRPPMNSSGNRQNG